MKILISGSLVYDYIINFPDSFKNFITPGSPHLLDVAFGIESLRKTFGGPAGNIGYTMKLLGAEPLLVSSLGADGKEYLAHLKKHKIETRYISKRKEMTPSAYITTDADDNQIAAIQNTPVEDERIFNIEKMKDVNGIKLAIISSGNKAVMEKHLRDCKGLGIKTVFDPSHQLAAFEPIELQKAISMSDYIIGNDYEIKLLESKSGWNTEEILKHAKVLVLTLGGKGSVVRTCEGEAVEAGACAPLSFDDPTGAGDAYRAGFFTGVELGCAWKACAQMGSVAAAYAIENQGTQGHRFTREEFCARYERTFGEKLILKNDGLYASE